VEDIFLIVITKDQIRDGRALLRWSARELSEKAGVGMATIQRLESGERPVGVAKLDTLIKIKTALESGGIELLEDGNVRRKR
jgi:transcriptional regulator with XRE-family HTH domain